MTQKQKLSELMKLGAQFLAPHKQMYYNRPEPTAACAIGCVMYVLELVPTENMPMLSIRNLPFELQQVLDSNVPISVLPQDIQDVIDFPQEKYTLQTIIIKTNDYISRERAIEITEWLGY